MIDDAYVFLCLISIHYDYAILMSNILSPSSCGFGAYTLVM